MNLVHWTNKASSDCQLKHVGLQNSLRRASVYSIPILPVISSICCSPLELLGSILNATAINPSKKADSQREMCTGAAVPRLHPECMKFDPTDKKNAIIVGVSVLTGALLLGCLILVLRLRAETRRQRREESEACG
jgi:hypothetical protein